MTARALLEELRSHGARVWSQGETLELDAPADLLTPEFLAEVRGRKSELLRVLQSEAPQPRLAPTCPADQLDRDWQGALAGARRRFEEAGVDPDQATLEACAWLELQFSEGWRPRQGITEEGAQGLLEAVYAGRLVAGIKDHGRVVLREPDGTQVQR